MFHEIIIVGGGASGIMAALIAKDMGKDVAIIEHKDRIAKKILVTGNGRCNISNSSIEIENYHTSSSEDIIEKILSQFSLEDTENFFKSIGLILKSIGDTKLFPLSLQASSVVDLFLSSLNDKAIPVYANEKIKFIEKKAHTFHISSSNEDYTCNKLIMATGGKSYTKTGSDGSAYKFVREFGHSIVSLKPAIVQVALDYPKLKALSGVKFEGEARIFVDDNMLRAESGEILFTDYGISGPPILQLSRLASHNDNSIIEVDMFPNMTKEALDEFLDSHWGIVGYRSVMDSFIGIINKKLISTFLKECGLKNIHKPCWEITNSEKKAILNNLKSWRFNVSGTKGFESAQVTCGGVNCSEVDSLTLESKIIDDLYFCGEVLDVDGDCGGYNLQWAWSSGAVAGKSASVK